MLELLDCSFTCRDADHHAVMVNLSLKGALLSSRIEAPKGEIIDLHIPSEFTGGMIILKGMVVRSTKTLTDHGPRYKTVVHFNGTPPDLRILLAKLSAKYS
ncbi:MAG: PilZ domain-containing protein [Acidobacteria bacterium]|nr:PilZ domain-containing protein [Acidobacteriota bacterium]